MSRARELAKAGGVQQRIAGFSSHVGMSTFLAAVHMEDNLTVDGNIGVGGNLTVTGTTTFNGGTLTLGDANTDNVVFGGDVNSNIIPNTDNAYDLGSSSQEWKDLYVDGTANIDALVADTADINGGTVDGATVGANSASSGAFTTLTASGNVDLGDATSDTITATGRFDSDIVPSTDNARDLGASGLEFKDLYLDGTANIDSLVADTADINGGTVDGAAIGGASASTGAFTSVTASTTLGVTGTTTLAGQLDANGDVNLGNATTDSITVTGRFDSALIPLTDNAVDLGTSTLEYKDLYLDGTANIDALVADTADINGGTVDGATIGANSASSGAFTTLTASGNVDLGDATSDTITATGRFDSDLVPSSDDARDLGASGLEWKDLYIDGTANIDTISADSTTTTILNVTYDATLASADINGGSVDGATVGAASASSGAFTTLSASGNVDLGDATSDTITATGRFDSDLVPSTDGARDLGTSTLEWKDLYLDGTAHVDTLDVDGNAGVIGDLTVTGTTTLSTALANSNLANSTVAFGGITLSLGGSDATPAFNLTDATNYPTSSLSGTITNAQLAGSITGAKIANDTIPETKLDIHNTPTDGYALKYSDSNGLIWEDAGTATNATNITVSANNSTNETVYPIFVDGATGAQGAETDTGLTYNPSTGALTSTTFVGAVTGNVTGNTSGSSGSCTGNAAGLTGTPNITVGTVTASSLDISGDADIDGTTNLDAVDIDGAVDMASTLGVTGTTTLSGQLDANGDVNLGNATSDTITATGRFDSDLVPSGDNARDLGTSSLEWKDLYLDGTANIDSLVADTADINAGTIDNTVIGGSTAAAGSFTTVSATGDVTLTDTTADSAAGPELLLYRNSASPADGDYLATIKFQGESDTGATRNYAKITGKINDASNGSEDGILEFTHLKAGSSNISGRWNSTTLQLINGTDFSVAGDSSFTGDVTVTGALDANGGANIDNVRIGVANDNEIDTSSGNLVIDSAGGTTTVDDNLVISGNLTVNGTTQTINSTTVTIADKNFQVATGAADDAAADGGGLTVDSGDGDKTWNFEATGDNWGSSENINAASGKAYKINNTSVLNATTLGSGVVNSSLTTLGTIATGVWNGTQIGNAYLANSSINFGGVTLSLGGSDGTPAFDLSDATNYPTSSLSGTITNAQLAGSIANSKLSTISTANKVSISALNIDGGTDIGAALVNADEIIVDDGGGGTNRRCDMSRVKTYIYGAMSGDATAGSGGAVTLAASGVSAATYGSSTALPVITVDAKGRITSATTTAIDSTTISNGGGSVAVGSGGAITVTGDTTFANNINLGDDDTITFGAGSDGTIHSDGANWMIQGSANGITYVRGSTLNLSANGGSGGYNGAVTIDVSGDERVQLKYGSTTRLTTTSSGLTLTGTTTGTFSGNLTGNASGSSGSCTGNSATATILANARTIGGVSFDGSANINLPGVNASGNQDTSGNAATATKLAATKTIAGVAFDGSANISLNNNAITNGAGYITSSGTSAACSGNAATATAASSVTVADESSDTTCFPLFTTAATGDLATKSGSNLTFNSSSGALTATSFVGAVTGNVTGNTSGSSGSCTGNAATATILASARTIAGVSFNGSANISLNNNAITNGAGYITSSGTSAACSGNSATATILATARTIAGVSFDGSANISLNNNAITNGAGYITSSGNTSGSSGSCTGNAATATLASSSTISANNSNNETVYPVFVDGATGTQGLESDTGFSYNPNSNTLTAGTFSGALSGNATTATSATNADTVDSLHASSFVRSDTSDTMSGTLTMSGNIVPNANGTRDLGASGTRWANVYSSDLDLSNEAKGANKVDGTWGSYLIEEGEDNLYLTNRRNGKSYRFVLEEVS